MNAILKLTQIALIPVFASVICYFLFKKSKLSYLQKQIFIGIFFGVISIIGTEFGVPINGATMNVRDAAPLCAALFFGGPAGIIAGFIGGIERWFAVYWGAGSYTRLACCLSTCLAGILGAVFRKLIFEDKLPRPGYALLIGLVVEIIHMMMVFITNSSDIQLAFSVVKTCTLPMCLVNSLAVSLSALLILALDNEKENNAKKKENLSQQILKNLLILVVLALIFTSQFTLRLQNKLVQSQTVKTFDLNIQDIKKEVSKKSDENLLSICHYIYQNIDKGRISNEYLAKIADEYNVSEINIVNEKGLITYSSSLQLVGFDMSSGEQSAEFLCLLSGESEYAQDYQATTNNSNVYRKYAAIVMDEGGFIQVGYDAEEFHIDINKQVADVTLNRHIGEDGGIVIIDANDIIVSDSKGNTQKNLNELNVVFVSQDDQELGVLTINDVEYYYKTEMVEGYKVIAYQLKSEVDFSKEITIYLNIFMQTIAFAGLFILTYFLTKFLVVKNIRDINSTLQKITDGDLDNKVTIQTNEEFSSLSKGINSTVDSMKQLISEANKRIDDELNYAKEIQASVLPSTFPPFYNRKEFDIFASMNPAKEVGGDFYDFYLINDHTLAFAIADVSGKGIPAALFMMRAKTLLKTYAIGGISVADIFTNANFNLCEGNDTDMFVTAWMGILDTQTGELAYANAGHNRPLIKRKDGNYEYLKGPAGFILGGMEGVVYKPQNTILQEGDEIFLYTDGVTEATNKDKQLFGDDKLLEIINQNATKDAQGLVEAIKKEIDDFYDGAPQFDDITMLSLKYLKKYHENH